MRNQRPLSYGACSDVGWERFLAGLENDQPHFQAYAMRLMARAICPHFRESSERAEIRGSSVRVAERLTYE